MISTAAAAAGKDTDMALQKQDGQRAEKFRLLTQSARGTPMGDLLRRFWQPVALSAEVAPGKAKAIRIFSEDLTLYRGASGKPYLVGRPLRAPLQPPAYRLGRGRRDPLRLSRLEIRRHRAVRRNPGRRAQRSAAKVKIGGYPMHEYCGLIFAYLGEGPAPAFDLPRKDVFEQPGRDHIHSATRSGRAIGSR